MLAKLIAYGSSREEAVEGVGTTSPSLRFLMGREEFVSGAVTTHLVEDVMPEFLDRPG